jgi:hypothetical protein
MRLAAFCRFSARSSMMVIELAVCDSHSPHYEEYWHGGIYRSLSTEFTNEFVAVQEYNVLV